MNSIERFQRAYEELIQVADANLMAWGKEHSEGRTVMHPVEAACIDACLFIVIEALTDASPQLAPPRIVEFVRMMDEKLNDKYNEVERATNEEWKKQQKYCAVALEAALASGDWSHWEQLKQTPVMKQRDRLKDEQ